MGSDSILSLTFHWIGGFAFATAFIPFRGIKRWSWDVYWIIQSFAAWIVAPAVLTTIFVPSAWSILSQSWHASPAPILHALLWGILWGVGTVSFGLAIRYLGIALGYTLALGLCGFFGTVLPLIYRDEFPTMLHSGAAMFVFAGLAVCLCGIAITAAAAASKDQEFTLELKLEAGERDFAFGKGLVLAAVAGLTLTFIVFGISAAQPITALAQSDLVAAGGNELWASLPALLVVLAGGFVTNLVWSIFVIVKDDYARQFTGEPGLNPMRATATAGNTLVDFDPLDPSTYDRVAPRTLAANYLLAALAGLIWYLHFFLYAAGQTGVGGYGLSSWLLDVATMIFFASLWGLVLREWHGTSSRTRLLATAGAALIIASSFVVALGHYTVH